MKALLQNIIVNGYEAMRAKSSELNSLGLNYGVCQTKEGYYFSWAVMQDDIRAGITIDEEEINDSIRLTVRSKHWPLTEAYLAAQKRFIELRDRGWIGVRNDSSFILEDREISFEDTSKALWKLFSDIPVNQYGLIEHKFINFEAGEEVASIYKWFEKEFYLSVPKDLMSPQTN